jgi:hypothetical protein
MANLNTRGTLTRNRWDYYESSNVWAFIYGTVASGPIYAYLFNNATAQTQLDVYMLSWSASLATLWDVALYPPQQTVTPLTPAESELHTVQPDAAAPTGAVGMAIAIATSTLYRIDHRSDSPQAVTINLGTSSPFITLPPGWILAVSGSPPSECELSMTVWYQQVLDNVAPAP